jgi:vancomycin resistance protein VanJ
MVASWSSLRALVAAIRVGLGTLVIAYVVSITLILALLAFGSVRDGWPAFVREMMLYLFVPTPFLLAAGLILRARRSVVVSLMPLGIFVFLYGSLFLPKAPTAATGAAFRVLSYNVGAARGLGDPEAVMGAVREADADVIVLVEARPDSLRTIGAALADSHPHQVGSQSVFVFSRLQLYEPRGGLVRSGAHDSLLADVEVNGRLVALAAVHLQRTESYSGSWRGMSALVSTVMQYRTSTRDDAIRELSALLHGIAGPHVLAGDFNMTPSSRSYQLMRAHYQDSHVEAGWGFGHTYPASSRTSGVSVPLLRIDYIFHSPDVAAIQSRVARDQGSDHRAIVADLATR